MNGSISISDMDYEHVLQYSLWRIMRDNREREKLAVPSLEEVRLVQVIAEYSAEQKAKIFQGR